MQVYQSPKAQELITQIARGGKEKLHIVSDFDGTITLEYDESGKKLPSGIALLRDSGMISSEYTAKAEALFAHYYPFEISLDLDLAEKKCLMVEWWTKHLQLLVESGVTKDLIIKITQSQPKIFRQEIDVFFQVLNQLHIPILIFSAGIGDIIDSLMKLHVFTYPNIHTISNNFIYDTAGKAAGFNQSQIIHTFNKDETAITNQQYRKEIQDRKNVILLGNSQGDISMANNLENEILLKIGFLDKVDPDSKNLNRFLEVYDVVITGGGDFSFINNLVSVL